MTMWSGGVSRPRIFSMAGRKSSATVQQMQPLESSMMSSAPQASLPQSASTCPSKPTSPNSLTISAIFRPPGFCSRWRISVVLPAPRKPVTIVAGMRVWLALMALPSGKAAGRPRRTRRGRRSPRPPGSGGPARRGSGGRARLSGTRPRPTSLETRTTRPGSAASVSAEPLACAPRRSAPASIRFESQSVRQSTSTARRRAGLAAASAASSAVRRLDACARPAPRRAR